MTHGLWWAVTSDLPRPLNLLLSFAFIIELNNPEKNHRDEDIGGAQKTIRAQSLNTIRGFTFTAMGRMDDGQMDGWWMDGW